MAAAALTANTAMAETKLNVPFNFTVDGKTCPAGQYAVLSDQSGNAVKLQGVSHSFTWLLHSGDPAPGDKHIVLKFDEIGSDHFLRSVQYRDQITSRLDGKAKDMEKASIRVVGGE
jgi:hypothetical protein